MKNLTLAIFISLSLLLIPILSEPKEYSYPPRTETPAFKALFQQFSQFTSERKYKEAIEELERIIKKYPDDTLIQVYSYTGLGNINCFFLKNYKKAIQAYQLGIKKIPKNDKNYDKLRTEYYYGMARSYEKLAAYNKTIELSQQLIAKYPDSDFTEGSVGLISHSLKKKGSGHENPKILGDLAKEHANTPIEESALKNLVRYYMEQKEYKLAALKCQEILNKFPNTGSTSFADDTIKYLQREGKIELPLVIAEKVEEAPPEKVIVRGLTRQQLVRFIGIPLVALAVLIYICILIVRWRKKK